ncbi:MAG: DUF6168 family protein [Robiginitalea sp.]|uniref:DUF6168 family protein n=1 Tax=Robiginitalea sp. TaxID=1902411 RepID=UPI003C714220
MKNISFLGRCLILLSLVLSISFGIHALLRTSNGVSPFGDLLIWSYLTNLALAFGIVVFIHSLRHKMKTQLGFLFIAGSFVKFLLFFIFFYPSFTEDERISQSEFSSFFVPYFLALLIETYFTAVLLKNLEKENPL